MALAINDDIFIVKIIISRLTEDIKIYKESKNHNHSF